MQMFHSLRNALILLFISCPIGYSQTKISNIQINEVTVVGERLRNFNTGHFYSTIDSLARNIQPSANLSELVTQQSLLQVNTYGTGSSSISARGTGEKRTPVIWNGFNIQSILSAGTDVAQLPGFFFEDMKVQMGGSSALFGSGSAGGVLYLNNKLIFSQNPHAEINASMGSFGSYGSGVKVTFGNSYYSGSLKAFYQTAKNDFPYKDTYVTSSSSKLIDTTQSNARAKSYGVMFNNVFQINSSQLLKLNFWYNDNDKNIAPTLADVAKKKSSDASQHDKFTAGSAEWNYRHNRFGLWARSGIFHSTLDYAKPSASTFLFSKATWSVNELEGSLALGLVKVIAGINETMEFGKASSFDGSKERYRSALFSSVTLDIPKVQLKYNVSARGEIINGSSIPLTYSTGFEKMFFNSLTIKGNLAKNYRVPSFNDLYYVSASQYGNPDLKPETGINYEAGAEYSKLFNTVLFSLGFNGFLSDMKDWMNWVQLTNKDYTVQNIDKARIKGIESYASATIPVGGLKIQLKGMATLMDAKDRNTDKFLANIPKNKWVGSAILQYKQSSLMYQQTWAGKRYSNSSNTQELDAYNIGNLVLSQSINMGTGAVAIDFGLYNMWNKDYMILQNYPMMGRNFKLGLRVKL